MATIYKPPAQLGSPSIPRFSVFLAGSIEMGSAPNWQADLESRLSSLDVDIYNPRRDNWDPTWQQSANNPKFREQVEWELDGIEKADLVVMYLAPSTIAPISLLELGFLSGLGFYALTNTVVCCPEGFHRKGNVDIVCDRYGIPQVSSLEGLELAIRTESARFQKRASAYAPT
jgi:hypothetical protein